MNRPASPQEAAEYAGVHHCTIRRWIRQGKLTGYRVGDWLLRVDLDDVDKLITPVAPAQPMGAR
ncbi:MAG TPA: excisionase family DNA-binding protein [Streptosporangiaceae bacterium]